MLPLTPLFFYPIARGDKIFSSHSPPTYSTVELILGLTQHWSPEQYIGYLNLGVYRIIDSGSI